MLLPTAAPLDIWRGVSRSRAGTAGTCWCRKRPCPGWPEREFRFSSRDRPPMSRSSRRFKILLPRRFNDGQPVPDELLADTLIELRMKFGAVLPYVGGKIRGYAHGLPC